MILTRNVRSPMRTLSLSLGAIVALTAAAGCDGTQVAEPAVTPPATTSVEDTLAPVAKLDLEGGQALEFYELGGSAFVMESGQAGQATIIGGMTDLRADKLVDLWKHLAPAREAPKALVEMQARLLTAKTADLARPVQIHEKLMPTYGGFELPESTPPIDTTGETLAAPWGCNNGCCDFNWLKGFIACNARDYSWFLYNYNWSYGNVGDAYAFYGMVCSASGTSTYKVWVEGGGGGTWSVPEATYRQIRVIAPLCCNDPDIKTTVNSSTNPHLHTHCGTATI